jgi:hypothetical protein
MSKPAAGKLHKQDIKWSINSIYDIQACSGLQSLLNQIVVIITAIPEMNNNSHVKKNTLLKLLCSAFSKVLIFT